MNALFTRRVTRRSLAAALLPLTLSLAACSSATPHPKNEAEAAPTQVATGDQGPTSGDTTGARDAALGQGDRSTKPEPTSSGSGLADRDGDGVVDSGDKCPTEPEDRDNFQDEDGCPDPDNDSDGIRDQDDRCPDAAETKNGFQDDDGCPDVKK